MPAAILPLRVGDQCDLIISVVEEVLKLLFGERSLLGGLLVVLAVGGGVPREKHLRGMCAEPLFADAVPAVVRVGDVGAKQPEAVLIAPDRGLAAALDAAQVAEELVD